MLDRVLGAQRLLTQERGLLQELNDVVAVRCAQRRGPALVLLEQTDEPLPASLGELELSAVAVEDVDLLPLVGEQDLFEFGVLLDVALTRALLELVQRWLGDVDVAGLDQLFHLTEEKGENQ